jgi:hypothetical protein
MTLPFNPSHAQDHIRIFPETLMLYPFGITKMKYPYQQKPLISSYRHLARVRGAVKYERCHQDEDVEQLRGIQFALDRDGTLVIVAGDPVFQHVFLDADTRADEKEHDERFS